MSTSILVVDDSAVDRRRVQGLLSSQWQVEVAEHGAQALEKVRANAPSLVVTDLQMPELDGLGLVQQLEQEFPELPVILMTAHGSEALAVQALGVGAASYVPKALLQEVLVETVAQVLSLVQADRNYARLIECLSHTRFCFELRSDPALIEPLVDMLQQMTAGMKLCGRNERLRLGVALEQAFFNALYHGNLEFTAEEMRGMRDEMLHGGEPAEIARRRAEAPFNERKMFVDVQINPDQARYVIRDQGQGFDVSSLPKPGDPANMEGQAGRGLVLMQTFMDEVLFNGAGNEVTLIKRRK